MSLRAVLTVATLAATLGACAALEGLGDFQKGQSCSIDCDASLDATVDVETPDALPATGDSSGGPPPNPDSGGDPASDGGAEPDSGTEAPDSGTVGARDSGSPAGDSGCGSLASVENCGACGVACNMTTGTPSCTGATCTYSCITGRADCNMTAPDTDGCECATPGCCGTGCQTSHADGVGQPYFDCNAPKTYSETTALAACTAYATSVGSNAASCVGPLYCKGSTAPTVCFTTSGGECSNYCWQYSGKYADAGAGTVWDCSCPGDLIGSWN